MPLKRGSSPKVIGENIRELILTGKYSREQASAISYAKAGKSKKGEKK